jgi:hypothetical protein
MHSITDPVHAGRDQTVPPLKRFSLDRKHTLA